MTSGPQDASPWSQLTGSTCSDNTATSCRQTPSATAVALCPMQLADLREGRAVVGQDRHEAVPQLKGVPPPRTPAASVILTNAPDVVMIQLRADLGAGHQDVLRPRLSRLSAHPGLDEPVRLGWVTASTDSVGGRWDLMVRLRRRASPADS